MIKEGKWFSAVLNRSDGATDDGFIGRFKGDGAGVNRKEVLARCHETAIGAPKIIKKRRYDAVMHMAGNNVVEFVELS